MQLRQVVANCLVKQQSWYYRSDENMCWKIQWQIFVSVTVHCWFTTACKNIKTKTNKLPNTYKHPLHFTWGEHYLMIATLTLSHSCLYVCECFCMYVCQCLIHLCLAWVLSTGLDMRALTVLQCTTPFKKQHSASPVCHKACTGSLPRATRQADPG